MNLEHVKIVKQGKEAIDAWRRAHLEERLDLTEADLNRADLSGANLAEADLKWVDLSEADLSRANLSGMRLVQSEPGATGWLRGADLYKANLHGADLSEADLSRADLIEANLSQAKLLFADIRAANLTGADLRRADLRGANLRGADLPEADLRRATLLGTTLVIASLGQTRFAGAFFGHVVIADCDLSVALGLDSVKHLAPSSIGLDTIIRSGGNIPEAFLRGAGVPDTIITYVRSLVVEPVQFYTCFISYASPNQAFAQRLYNDLQGKGVRCWYYPETAIMGRRVWEDIDRAIRVYDKLIVICSRASLTSPAVLREIEHALAREDAIARENAQKLRDAAKGEPPRLKDKDVLFPIRLDNYVFDGWEHQRKLDVTGRTIGDFVGWRRSARKYEASLGRLLHALDPKSWPAVE